MHLPVHFPMIPYIVDPANTFFNYKYIQCSGDPKSSTLQELAIGLFYLTVLPTYVTVISNTSCQFLVINVGIIHMLHNKSLVYSKYLKSNSPFSLISVLPHSLWFLLESHPSTYNHALGCPAVPYQLVYQLRWYLFLTVRHILI